MKIVVFCWIVTWSVFAETKQEHIYVKESSVTNIDVGSIALIFSVTVYNPRAPPCDVEIMSEKCCIDVDKEKDCRMMKIYGGYKGELQSKETKMVSFIYPTLYPYDMIGSCILLLKMAEFTQKITIPFNTTLEYNKPVRWLPDFINEYLFDVPVSRKCNSPDEDRLNDCSPVLCDVKYHGLRNHFDLGTRKCLSVPDCSGSDVDPPVMVYDSQSNSCRNITRPLLITDEEKQLLSVTLNEVEEFQTVDWSTEGRLDCNHGDLDSNKSTCICNHGWESLVLPYQEIDPYTGLLQMCNQQRGGYWKHFVFGVSLAVFIIILLHLTNWTYQCSRKSTRYREQSPQISPIKAGCFQTLHQQYSPKNLYVRLDDESLEYERKGLLGRVFQKLFQRVLPSKKSKLDFSIEEISVGTTLLSPVSMDESYEIN